MTRCRGHTLVELVAVIVIIGILAAVAGPRFFATSVFEARGFAAELAAGVRYAQKLAIASGCAIRVTTDAGGYRVERWTNGADCNDRSAATALVARPGGTPLQGTAPGGIGLNSIDFYFDRIGQPRAPAGGALLLDPGALRIEVAGVSLQVEPETGYVREL